MPFGFSIAEKLKADLNRADVVFAIITPMSLKSQWVLFERGASWALGKLVVPVLAPGLKPSDLPGPLAQYPAVNVSNNDAAARMYDSISQVATLLQLEEKRGGRPAAKLSKFWKTSGRGGRRPSRECSRRERSSWRDCSLRLIQAFRHVSKTAVPRPRRWSWRSCRVAAGSQCEESASS